MLCIYDEYTERSQDVPNMYGNILVFKENHLQCLIGAKFQGCKNLWTH